MLVLGWPQFQKKLEIVTQLWCCPLWSFSLPTNFRRCDLPPCTPALGKDPPAMPRSLSTYLHSTGTLFRKKNPLPMDRDRKEKVTTLDHDHQHDDGFQCSTTVWFFERCKSSISVFSFFGAWYASNTLHILLDLCLRHSYLSLRNPRSSNTLSSARHA